jgi:predicted nucleic acid-binding protein
MAAVNLSDLAGQHLYLDANIFIYAMERHPDYVARVDRLFANIDAGGNTASTSEITLAECLVKPFADQDAERQRLYEAAISTRPHFGVVPVSRPILIYAAQLRAEQRLRLPDAIHAATALTSGCQTILTNDNLIRPIPGIEVIQLADLMP